MLIHALFCFYFNFVLSHKNNNLYIINLIAIHTIFVCLSKKTCEKDLKKKTQMKLQYNIIISQFDYFPLSFSPTFDPWRSRRPVINVTLFVRMDHPNDWWRKKIQKVQQCLCCWLSTLACESSDDIQPIHVTSEISAHWHPNTPKQPNESRVSLSLKSMTSRSDRIHRSTAAVTRGAGGGGASPD